MLRRRASLFLLAATFAATSCADHKAASPPEACLKALDAAFEVQTAIIQQATDASEYSQLYTDILAAQTAAELHAVAEKIKDSTARVERDKAMIVAPDAELSTQSRACRFPSKK